MAESIVREKSFEFAKRTINLYKYLSDDKKEYVLSKQLLRSGTSIGANIVEAQYGISKKEFTAKMYIALKECAETIYWIELIYHSDYISEKEYNSIKTDCDELRKILSSITKSSKT